MLSKFIPWLVFILFGYCLMGGLFSARLGIIDDHEIPYYLGADGELKVSEVLPTLLEKTEIGEWGEYLRFRPSYYTLRIIETMLWKENATLWFFTRYLLIVLSMWMAWKIMSNFFPKIMSYLFIFYIFTMPFWPDILTRLGPSEIYGIPALLGFAYGYVFNKSWLVLFSYVVGVGAKENFLFLLPVFILWIYRELSQKRISPIKWVAIIGSLIFTFWITSGILVATSKTGTDMYLSKISYFERLFFTLQNLPTIFSDRHLWPAIIVYGYMLIQRFYYGDKNTNHKSIIFALILLITIISQYVFYDNKLPSLTRYDFPAMILVQVFNLSSIYTLIDYYKKSKNVYILQTLLYSGLTLIMITYIFHRGYSMQLGRVDQVTVKSKAFSQKIDFVAQKMKQKPEYRLIFVSDRFIHFEPATSVLRYLVSRSVDNTFELKYIPEKNLDDPLGVHLEGRMVGAMTGKNTEDLFSRFSPYSDPKDKCYSITFGEALPLGDCPEIARF